MAKRKPAKPKRESNRGLPTELKKHPNAGVDRQKTFEGMTDDPGPELIAAGDQLEEARNERMAWGNEESERQEELIKLMKDHKVKCFRLSSGRVAQYDPGEPKEKVKLRTVKDKD